MMMALPTHDRQRRGVAPDQPAQDRRPQDRRILQGREHRGAGQRERPDDEDEAGHRYGADQEHEAEIEKSGRRPCPGNGRRPDQAAADELPKDKRQPVDAPELSGDRLAEREACRSEQRDRRGLGEHLRRGPQRDQDADEADQDGDPAKALDLFAEQRRRQRRDDERRRHIEGHHVGERHGARRVIEGESIHRRAQDAHDLQPGLARIDEIDAPRQDHRRQHDAGADRAQQHQLTDAVVGDQPFAERVVDREQSHAGDIEDDAEARGSGARDRHGILKVWRLSVRPAIHSRKRTGGRRSP